jgi:hypothetical protein
VTGALRIFRQSAHGGGKVAIPVHRPPYPLERSLVHTFLTDCVHHSAIVRPDVKDTVGNRTRDFPACSAGFILRYPRLWDLVNW